MSLIFFLLSFKCLSITSCLIIILCQKYIYFFWWNTFNFFFFLFLKFFFSNFFYILNISLFISFTDSRRKNTCYRFSVQNNNVVLFFFVRRSQSKKFYFCFSPLASFGCVSRSASSIFFFSSQTFVHGITLQSILVVCIAHPKALIIKDIECMNGNREKEEQPDYSTTHKKRRKK